MRPIPVLTVLALATIAAPAFSHRDAPPALVRFEGAIGVDPVASLNTATTNVVRGVNPGGRHWVLRKLKARIGVDGSISAKGAGLLLGSGENIATRGGTTHVAATLACGPADATARRFTSTPWPLDLAGDFHIKGVLSEDGVNAAVLPPVCENPQLLIRSANPSTGVAGNWFAAGIVAREGDDD